MISVNKKVFPPKSSGLIRSILRSCGEAIGKVNLLKPQLQYAKQDIEALFVKSQFTTFPEASEHLHKHWTPLSSIKRSITYDLDAFHTSKVKLRHLKALHKFEAYDAILTQIITAEKYLNTCYEEVHKIEIILDAFTLYLSKQQYEF